MEAGGMEEWRIGQLENWRIGVETYSNTPILQHSPPEHSPPVSRLPPPASSLKPQASSLIRFRDPVPEHGGCSVWVVPHQGG